MNVVQKTNHLVQKYSPIRINFILIGLALYFLYQSGYSVTTNTLVEASDIIPNHFKTIIVFIAKFAFRILLLLTTVSLGSTLLSWTWSFYNRNKHGNKVLIEAQHQQDKTRIKITIPYLFHPILGFIKGYLSYNNTILQAPIIFKRKRIFSFAQYNAENLVVLQDITTYKFEKIAILYTDMFRMVQLYANYKINYTHYNPPKNLEFNVKNTEDFHLQFTDEKIKSKRTAEGDYINYKSFEFGDDIRRIVWKIYAKNKELIVRTPDLETKNRPQVQLLASFYTQIRCSENIAKPFLNYYKNCIWTIIESYLQSEITLHYKNDCNSNIITENAALMAANITHQEWQQTHSCASVYKRNKDNIILLHSLSQLSDIQEVLAQTPQTQIYFVRLSNVIEGNVFWHWLHKLFFVNSTPNSDLYANYWISNQKKKIQKNEKLILQYLESASSNYQVL